ncbi:MAG: hypothetical protein ACFCBW_18320, partial [Candidatus Competibacterales bacterium]
MTVRGPDQPSGVNQPDTQNTPSNVQSDQAQQFERSAEPLMPRSPWQDGQGLGKAVQEAFGRMMDLYGDMIKAFSNSLGGKEKPGLSEIPDPAIMPMYGIAMDPPDFPDKPPVDLNPPIMPMYGIPMDPPDFPDAPPVDLNPPIMP